MTREHIFFIPVLFALGFVAGALATRRHTAQQNAGASPAQPSGRVVIVALLLVLLVFAATHLLSLHGGVQHLSEQLRGQAIFDQRASFTADEVYARLEGFGAEGRSAYQQLTFTSDLVFPLVLFHFLLQLTRFVLGHGAAPRPLRFLALAVPTLWLLADLAENAAVYVLLGAFPQRQDGLAGLLGLVTYAKFSLLVLSLVLPAVLLWRNARRV